MWPLNSFGSILKLTEFKEENDEELRKTTLTWMSHLYELKTFSVTKSLSQMIKKITLIEFKKKEVKH